MVLDATVYAWDFDAGRLEGRLGLDLRLGLPLATTAATAGRASRRASRTAARTACGAIPTRPGRRLRGDGRRPASLRRRRRDVGAHLARVARRDGARGRPRARAASTSAPRARASSTPTTAARTLESGSRGLAGEPRRRARRRSRTIPRRVFFFRAFAGEESGVWEARGPRRSARSRAIRCPPSASLAAFRDARRQDGPARVELVRRAGLARRRRPLGGAARSRPRARRSCSTARRSTSRCSSRPTASSETDDGARFAAGRRAACGPRRRRELLADRNGDPLLEIKTRRDAVLLGRPELVRAQEGRARRRDLHEGRAPTSRPAATRTSRTWTARSLWEEGRNRARLHEPAAGL